MYCRNLLAVLLFLVHQVSTGQYVGLGIANLHGVNPASTTSNPAIKPNNKRIIGFPFLTNHDVYAGLNPFSINKIYEEENEELELRTSLTADLWKRNKVEFNIRSQWLYYGATNGLGDYFDISLSTRSNGYVNFSDNLTHFLIQGNEDINDPVIDLKRNNAKVQAYHELAFGYNRLIAPTTRLGIRIKVLSGIGMAQLRNPGGELNVSQSEWSFDVRRLLFRSSGFDIDRGEGLKWLNKAFNPENWGLGLDIGISTQVTEDIKAGFSILDIGAIRWGVNTYDLDLKNYSYRFSGIEVDANTDFEARFDELEADLDSIGDQISNSDTAHVNFISTTIPTSYLFVEKQLSKSRFIGASLFTQFQGTRFSPALTAYYKMIPNEKTGILANLTLQNRSLSLGASATKQFGRVNVFVGSDNITSILIPARVKSIDARIGAYISLDPKENKRRPTKKISPKKASKFKGPNLSIGKARKSSSRNFKKKRPEPENQSRKTDVEANKTNKSEGRTFKKKETSKKPPVEDKATDLSEESKASEKLIPEENSKEKKSPDNQIPSLDETPSPDLDQDQDVPALDFKESIFVEERLEDNSTRTDGLKPGGYIVFGVFNAKANAEHFKQRMLKKGYRTKIGYLSETKYYYAYKYQYALENRAEAIEELKAWHNHPIFPNTWLLLVKPR